MGTDRVPVGEDENVLEINGGYTTMWIYLMSQNCTLKHG